MPVPGAEMAKSGTPDSKDYSVYVNNLNMKVGLLSKEKEETDKELAATS
jgi:hypothetical protein